MLLLIIFVLAMALAATNGANDVSKGVATLAGSGVARYRTAILWGAATTLAGALVSNHSGITANLTYALLVSRT